MKCGKDAGEFKFTVMVRYDSYPGGLPCKSRENAAREEGNGYGFGRTYYPAAECMKGI